MSKMWLWKSLEKLDILLTMLKRKKFRENGWV